VAAELVPQVPAALRDAMAAEYLVLAYFRDERDRELRGDVKPPRKRSAKRARVATQPVTDAEIDKRFWDGVNRAVDIFTKSLRAQITAELLGESFTVEDGSTVTWGDATAVQHREASMRHQLNAAEHLETASRHQVAIDMLNEAGAACLNECVASAA
jgi:hypothetical protein